MAEVTLTLEQASIAEAPADSRIFVTAGPGTGKTHTLVARLAFLTQKAELSPGRELLVLSFTRNAVREIRRRARDAHGDVAYVQARTFDSFATRMLDAVAPGGGWSAQGYDGRIKALAEFLGDPPDELWSHLNEIEHILIDEIQDLVSCRVEMVRRLLEVAPCGFTLFGDPAQAIYDYQDRKAGRTTVGLLEWANSRFPDLVTARLTVNHRIKNPLTASTLATGEALGARDPKAEDAVREAYRRLPALPDLRAVRSGKGTTAILCRTNGQALTIADQLAELGIPHVLFGDGTSWPIEAWLARALIDVDTAILTRADLDTHLASAGVDSIDQHEAWRALRAMGRSGRNVDLRQVASRLRARWVPDELVQPVRGGLVVSSIHRSKGLEFDNVVVATNADSDIRDGTDSAEEARVLYVAMTRASSSVYRLDLCSPRRLRNYDDRWVEKTIRRKGSRAIELLPTDVDHSVPPSGPNHRAADIQDYLWRNVRRGDPVELVVDCQQLRGFPRYVIYHYGIPIGRTSPSFTAAMRREIYGDPTSWPARIEGARVSCVESVAGTQAEAERAGFKGHGFWIAVRLEGLGRYVWGERVAHFCGGEDRAGRSQQSDTAPSQPQPSRPRTSKGRKELWARLVQLADSGDLTAIEQHLPAEWAHKRDELASRAERAAERRRSR